MGYSYDYRTLEKNYGGFESPLVKIEVNKKSLSNNNLNLIISDLEIDLTSDMEASMASFKVYNVYDPEKGCFKIEELKKYILLGSSIDIFLGYQQCITNIFKGYIARVNFIYEHGDAPYIEIACMDIKGIMMASSYSKQLKAKTYSAAVKEILQKTAYDKLKNMGIITSLDINNTPDNQTANASAANKETDETIEMVAESDYEFVVKAAKKFRFEFFTENGCVHFRKSKSTNGTVLMALALDFGLLSFDIGYDITGLVESVEARGMDVSKGKVIASKSKFKGKYSIGNKVKPLIKGSSYTYIDPSIHSEKQAEYRADALLDDISYRLGNIECECIGIPELMPGNFVEIKELGKPVQNIFYITHVKHIFNDDNGYRTIMYGKADSVEVSMASLGSLGSIGGLSGAGALGGIGGLL